MKTKYLIILFICGSLWSCNHKPADPSIVRSTKYKKSLIEGYQKLGLFCNVNQIPGMTIAVSIDNQLIWADGFGYSNQEFKIKASPSHKFRIGQITEVIAALTAAKLIDNGKLLINKPVSEYLPDLCKKPFDFTIRQLGAHSGGLKVETQLVGKGTDHSIEKNVQAFINDSLIYEPGSAFLHTELGFDLIGHIIEKTNHKIFSKIVKELLTDTLKLTNTVPDVFFKITDNRSQNYEYDYMSQPIIAQQIDLRGKESSAGYLSSVIDLVKIGNTLLYPGFLKKETCSLLTSQYKLKSGTEIKYGFGLIASKDIQNKQFYGQRGSVTGGTSALLIYPDDKLVIAMSTNIQSDSWELPVFEIAKIFMDQLHPEKEEAGAKTK